MKLQDALNILGLQAGATIDQIKAAYKAAAIKFHPDRNPAGLEMMKLVNAANDTLRDYDGSTPKHYQAEVNYGEKLNDALNAIISLNLKIEVCGAWVWVFGDTYAAKDTLKKAGYKFAGQKKAWYYRPDAYVSSSRGKWEMDDIRDKYGSKVVKEPREMEKLK